ncbi:hypothetical protein U472_15320 [Orenia metallireducens]|uniref:Uncharacterized protein n=1 Tax=Orenia metallireducens TaxID=1413210 RepID=A0A1C0A6D8_9FIRM|nr:hypothetical protein U472_15320 [Orenia metallireducens]
MTSSLLIKYLKIYLLGGVLLFALTPTIILITLIFKDFMPAIGFSIFTSLVAILITNSKYAAIFP